MILLFVLLFLGQVAEAQQQIMPVSQVQAGMKGKGRTVFQGTLVEEFDVDILGVLRNEIGPKKSMILARLTSEKLQETGLPQGMSGSPVYVDGRLIGAVAYGFSFAKETITGITPIEEMLSIENTQPPRSTFSSPRPIKKYMSPEELIEMHQEVLSPLEPAVYEGQSLLPLRVPLVFSGFSAQAFAKNRAIFSRLGFSPVMAGSASQTQPALSEPDISLKPGDMVGVQLISGDLNMTATGTVTHVDGNKVLAFGHPMYNLGAVEYAMTKAEVITMLPSYQTSFKIATPGIQVGRILQDRSSGVFGELGQKPRMIPVNIELLNSSQDIRTYSLKIVEDKLLTPLMLHSAISSLMLSEERTMGDLSIEFRGNIFLENGDSIEMEDLFSGNLDVSTTNLAQMLLQVTYFLSNNEFQDLGIHRIDLRAAVTEDVRVTYLEKVLLEKYDVSPGEYVNMQIFLRNFRGQSVVQEGAIPVPALPSGSECYLIVADSMALAQMERTQYRTQGIVPRNISQMVRLLSNMRKNNRIYIKIVGEKPGLYLRGEELPNLPPSVKAMFASPRAASSAPTDLTRSTLFYTQVRVPAVVQGAVVIPLKIK
jgi:hypothetical protein